MCLYYNICVLYRIPNGSRIMIIIIKQCARGTKFCDLRRKNRINTFTNYLIIHNSSTRRPTTPGICRSCIGDTSGVARIFLCGEGLNNFNLDY